MDIRNYNTDNNLINSDDDTSANINDLINKKNKSHKIKKSEDNKKQVCTVCNYVYDGDILLSY